MASIKKMIIIISIIVILLIVATILIINGNNNLEISRYDIESKDIKADFDGFKIAQISDFHNNKSKKVKSSIIKSLEEEKPDIIVITGDLVDRFFENIDISIEFVENITKIAPVYYVTGNHESAILDYEDLKNKLENLGVKVLSNKKEIIKKESNAVSIIGLDDPDFYSSKDTLSENTIAVTEKLDEITKDDENYKILLCHRPELVDVYVKSKIDLTLTGHAHGGLIRLPFIGGLVAPSQGILPDYTEGVEKRGNSNMIVNRGAGNSGPTFRINNNPEIVYVTLKVLSET